VLEARLGPGHPDALAALLGMAECLFALDRADEAIPFVDDCLGRSTRQLIDPDFLAKAADLRLRHYQEAQLSSGVRQTAEIWEKLNRSDAASLYKAGARLRALSLVLPSYFALRISCFRVGPY
jgi:hypothetical protein